MNLNIRETGRDQASLLADLITISFRDVTERFGLTSESCPTHPSNCTAEWIQSATDKGIRFYVLENCGTPYGCVGLEQAKTGVCYLERLAVLPEFRRRGYGKALVMHALKKAKALGVKRVEIAIIAEHPELKAWYTKLGFVIEREAVNFEHLPFKVTFMSLLI